MSSSSQPWEGSESSAYTFLKPPLHCLRSGLLRFICIEGKKGKTWEDCRHFFQTTSAILRLLIRSGVSKQWAAAEVIFDSSRTDRMPIASRSKRQVLHPLAREMSLSCAFNPKKAAVSYSCDGVPAEQMDKSRKTYATSCLVVSIQMAGD